MNIFVLSLDPVEAARCHCDKHVVKMILEYAQLMSTAHRVLDGDGSSNRLLPGEELVYVDGDPLIIERKAYKATHINHPCAVWARSTTGNYEWLFALFASLIDEYTYRYGKVHATARLLDFLSNCPRNLPVGPKTTFPQAMPIELFRDGHPVEAYRNYYMRDKAYMAVWTRRPKPLWFTP